MEKNSVTPMLFPYEPGKFWEQIRQIVREEISQSAEQKAVFLTASETREPAYKPLYKITEVCKIFHVSKPTIYDWIKRGTLKPFKVRSRVYFLWNDIQALINQKSG